MKNIKLLSYNQALNIINYVAKNHQTNASQLYSIIKSSNLLLAEDIYSPINVPSFNNSAMDGFAIQSQIVNESVKINDNITLAVSGSIQAGDASNYCVENKHLAWEIMTGAPVPDVFDAVIPIENITIIEKHEKKYIEISEIIQQGRNIRKLGSDYQKNQIVVKRHTLIQSQHIMALSSMGLKEIPVIQKIKIAILSTGNELEKKSANSLNSGKIYNSNQPFLTSYCKNLNCDPVFVDSCEDNPEQFNRLIDQAISQQVKIIFSTGAVSMGKYDFIPSVLIARGATIHFHKSKIRPGKPVLFAELPDGTIYFGLPGNPIAAAAGMRFFASPFIRLMLNLKPERTLKAQLQSDITKKKGFKTFAKALVFVNETGQLCVDMLMDQGSYQSCSFAQSNCWLILAENKENIKAGEIVEIAPMIPNQMIV